MKDLRKYRPTLVAILFALALLLAAPTAMFAQGRGHGFGRGRGRGPDLNKKCGKFVNCHDARNGRLDGRGPRGIRVGRRFRNDNIFFRNRRFRRNNRSVIFVPRGRVIINRGDRDFDRDQFLPERRQERFDRFEQRDMRRHGRGRP